MPLVGAHVSTAGGLMNAIAKARSIGAEAIQVFPSNPRQWRRGLYSDQELSDFGRALTSSRLPLFVHSIYLINLASPDSELRERSALSLADAFRYAALAGAQAVVTHVGAHRDEDAAAAPSRVAGAIAQARRLAGPYGGVALLLESSAGAGTSLASTLPELRVLLAAISAHDRPAIPGPAGNGNGPQAFIDAAWPTDIDRRSGPGEPIGPTGLCLDTAHLLAAGYPLTGAADADALIGELASLELLGRVCLIHLNDSRSALGSHRDRHENLWEGAIGRPALTRLLGHPAFTHVPFVLEVPGIDGHGPDRRNVRRAKLMRAQAKKGPPAPKNRRPESEALP